MQRAHSEELHNAEVMPFSRHPGELSLLMEKDFRLPQLIRYTIIVLSGMTCAKAEPPHPPHEFRDFANLLAPDSAAKPPK